MLSQAKILGGSSLRFMEAYIAVGIIYWIVLLIIDKCLKCLEVRICRHL